MAISALTAVASVMGGGVAMADPSGAPSSTTPVKFDCGSAGWFTGFANSGNSQALTWNPYFLTGSDGHTELLLPTTNDIVVTVDGHVVFAPYAAKGGAPGSTTCVVSGESGAAQVGGAVTGNLEPR